MPDFETAIGLEIHAELKTKSKIYCRCPNKFGAEPNTLVCPVCLGFPGTLPILNERVVELAVMAGHAMNCKINRRSRQDRKNYFYPDLPKAYQISQADIPICGNGTLKFVYKGKEHSVRITRIHIEEDAGKLLHSSNGSTLIDFNRCGVPLIEIVTEPDLRSADEAHVFLDNIVNILRYTSISDCRMQEGSVRCDVNVSVRKKGDIAFGTRCEMKNVNSFSAAARAIEYEASRQISIIESGGEVAQETRRWDDQKRMSFVMRTKENAQDYRYFPEPDLGTIEISEEKCNELKMALPELPNIKEMRYISSYGLSPQDAAILSADMELSCFFDKCVEHGCEPRNAAKRILSLVMWHLNETGKKLAETCITVDSLCELISFTENSVISSSGEKTAFIELAENGGSASEIIERLGLKQNSDDSFLNELASTVINANSSAVNDYKKGKTNALGFLVGQAMKISKGKADPGKLKEIILKNISEENQS